MGRSWIDWFPQEWARPAAPVPKTGKQTMVHEKLNIIARISFFELFLAGLSQNYFFSFRYSDYSSAFCNYINKTLLIKRGRLVHLTFPTEQVCQQLARTYLVIRSQLARTH